MLLDLRIAIYSQEASIVRRKFKDIAAASWAAGWCKVKQAARHPDFVIYGTFVKSRPHVLFFHGKLPIDIAAPELSAIDIPLSALLVVTGSCRSDWPAPRLYAH